MIASRTRTTNAGRRETVFFAVPLLPGSIEGEGSIQAAIFRGDFAIQVEQIPDAAILEPTEAVVSDYPCLYLWTDLWPYRG
jgi:hypothetical protein